jgi:hypothetical protein
MRHSRNHPVTQPRNSHKVSQRGLFSLAMLLASMGAFGIAMLGGVKLVLELFGEGPLTGMGAKVVAIGLAYFVGWVTAMVAIRVYGNLILPILINWATWVCLVAVCYLYIQILKRMYTQPDDIGKFFKYLIVMAGSLGALVGLHLVIEDHDLRPFSIPLLIINLYQLGQIVFRYVFDTADVKPGFLWKDVVFFLGMAAVAISMLAHIGFLEPLRGQLTNYFDRNSVAIRSDD